MKIGSTLKLTGQWKDSEEEFHYKCKIIDKDEHFLFIDYPIDVETNRTVYLPLIEYFYVRFIENDSVYEFKSKAVNREKKRVPALKIERPPKEMFKRIQRRSYVRVATALDVSIHCPNQSFAPFTTITRDISGGGASIILPKIKNMLKKNQELKVYLIFQLASEQYVYLATKANVVRVVEKESIRTVSVSFNIEHHQDEEQLIKLCFDVQRKMRQQKLK